MNDMKEKGKLIESPQTTTKRLVTHEMARQAYFKLHNHVYNGGKVPLLSIPRRDEDVDCILCDYIEQNEWAELREAESPRPPSTDMGELLDEAVTKWIDGPEAIEEFCEWLIIRAREVSQHPVPAPRTSHRTWTEVKAEMDSKGEHPVPAPETQIQGDNAELVRMAEKLLEWMPIYSKGSSGHIRQMNLRAAIDKLKAEPVEYPSSPQVRNPTDCNCEHVHASSTTCRSSEPSRGAVPESDRIFPVGSEVKPRTGDKS